MTSIVLRAQDSTSIEKFKSESESILNQVDSKKGFCIYLASNKTDRLGFPISLAKNSEMLIHCLVQEKALLKKMRSIAIAKKLTGQVMIEDFSGKKLPYFKELAKLLVIEDQKLVGISDAELLRVLAPGGILAKKENSMWKFQIKKRPSGMDDWTHPHHGPDANLTSNDTVIKLPVSLKWLSGTPTGRGGFGSCASNRAVVTSGGRIFTIGLDDKGDPFTKIGGAVLLARDAYSGLFLWKIHCESSYGKVELDWRNVWPIVASEKIVYARIKKRLVFIDAVSGKVLKECNTTYNPSRLLLSNNTLVTACWAKKGFSNAKDGFENDRIRTVWWPSENGSLEAFDAQTGEKRWKHQMAVVTIASNNKSIFALKTIGNPPTQRELIAIDLKTGKINWRIPHTLFGPIPDTCLNFANKDVVVVSKTKSKGKRTVFVLNASDGKVKYTIPNTSARNIVGNELWCINGRYNLQTGKITSKFGLPRTYAGTNGIGGCIPPVVISNNIVTNARRGAFVEYTGNPKQPIKKSTFRGGRGACLQGMVPANGTLYTAQNNCACVGGQVGGFMALANNDNVIASPEEMNKKRIIEKGPAFGFKGEIASKTDWPTYRQNNERSSGVHSSLPRELKILWSKQVVEKRKDTFEMMWNSRYGVKQPLTQPIVVKDVIYLTAVNLGELIALNTSNGKLLWEISLASRIDSPPTYYQGLLYVGCHDGFLYVLRAQDGELAYKIRLAPKVKSLVAHGMVESLWPVAGSVLINDNIAYAMAGRSTTINGGLVIVAFEPASGETLWTINLDKGSFYRDALTIRKGELTFSNLRFNAKTGKKLSDNQKYYNQQTMIDCSWSGGFGKRSGRGFRLGRICKNIMAWNSESLALVSYTTKTSWALIPDPKKSIRAKHPDTPTRKDYTWSTNLRPHTAWSFINTVSLSGTTVFYGGSVFKYKRTTNPLGDFLWIHSAKDGKELQKPIKLKSKTCFDGIAIANNKAFICLQDGSVFCLGE